jgi:hypothetical protein
LHGPGAGILSGEAEGRGYHIGVHDVQPFG